jgi:excisionase family DNA binding protein
MDDEKLLSVREFSRRTTISEPLIRRLIQRGELDALRPTPRTTRIREAAVREFLERRS